MRPRRALAASILAVALAAPAAAHSSLGLYATNPVEHDDLGRSDEPDRLATSVLGPTVGNRVIDLDLDGVAMPDGGLPSTAGKVLAPGCTDDVGRQPSGLCGLWTIGLGTPEPLWAPGLIIPPRLAGLQGMSGNAGPGAFTPTKGSVVRFLDAVVTPFPYADEGRYVEVNRKLDDAGLRSALAGLDPSLAGRAVLPGQAKLWAWYGTWQDKNGNGVLDTMSSYCESCVLAPVPEPPDGAPVRPDEEFQWRGNCQGRSDVFNPRSLQSGYCALDAEAVRGERTKMVAFLFPGNHHSDCGGNFGATFVCRVSPADVPGRQVLHYGCGVTFATPPCDGVLPGFFHPGDARALDAADEQGYGDPLLGPQGSVAPDGEFEDRTGHPFVDFRHWTLGREFPMAMYDQSVLSTLVVVVGVGCPASPAATAVLLPACRFLDVDRYATLSPAAERVLGDTVKPTARAQWMVVREAALPYLTTVDALRNHRALNPSPLSGPVDDAAVDPGWSREPNHALDAYPGAVHRACADGTATHHGWCNGYAPFTGPRAYGDLRLERQHVIEAPYPYAGEAPGLLPLHAPGDHRPTLGPGEYDAAGIFGRWHDKTQVWEESLFDLLRLEVVTTAHATPPDGWVGNVVNRTGTFYYRGYTDEPCTTEQGPGAKPYGVCHPYLEGAVQDPHQMAPGQPFHGEWNGACTSVVDSRLVVAPADGVWSVPVIAWDRGPQPGAVLNYEDFTGKGAIEFTASCVTGIDGPVAMRGSLILPLGNLGEAVVTTITVRVGSEMLTDVDAYAGWG